MPGYRGIPFKELSKDFRGKIVSAVRIVRLTEEREGFLVTEQIDKRINWPFEKFTDILEHYPNGSPCFSYHREENTGICYEVTWKNFYNKETTKNLKLIFGFTDNNTVEISGPRLGKYLAIKHAPAPANSSNAS